MACLEMYNSNGGSSMSPRISFSNDFVEIKPEKTMRSSPLSKTEVPILSSSSSDFEFSVSNYSMMTADELFFKGKLLPFKETTQVQRTLREELLIDEEDPDDDEGNFTLRPPRPSSSSSSSSSPASKGRWKGLLGLKRAHIGARKADKINEERFVHQNTLVNTNPSQGALDEEEGSNCSRDTENGI